MAITTQEAKQLLREETPVAFAGTEYKKINALIFRRELDKWDPTAELLDTEGECVIIAPINRIERLEDTGNHLNYINEEDIRIFLQAAEAEMAALSTLTRQEKTTAAQDKLYSLLRLLMDLDKEFIKKINAEKELSTGTFGEAPDNIEYGKEKAPQGEEEWKIEI